MCLMTSEMIARGEGRRARAYWQDHKEALLQALSRSSALPPALTFMEISSRELVSPTTFSMFPSMQPSTILSSSKVLAPYAKSMRRRIISGWRTGSFSRSLSAIGVTPRGVRRRSRTRGGSSSFAVDACACRTARRSVRYGLGSWTKPRIRSYALW